MFVFATLVTLVIQLTDFKIGDVKLGDIYSLLLIPYFLSLGVRNKGETFFKQLLMALTITFALSYLVLLWVDLFPISYASILKSPGVISLSRYVQYVGCVFFAWTIQVKMKRSSPKKQKAFFVLIDSQMFYWGIFFIGIWALSFAGVDSPFVYGEHRLRGGYVEGGPFGLMFATYFVFRIALLGFSKRWFALLAAVVVSSQSKAALLFLLASTILLYFPLTERSKGLRIILPASLAFVLFGSLLSFDLAKRLDDYERDMASPEQQLAYRIQDTNFVMGRISASYIAPRMFEDNMLLGVGFGNYSLTRNNPKYLGPFPYEDAWDLTGFGGIVNYVLEGGIFGFAIFLLPFLIYWVKNQPLRKVAYAAFTVFFLSQLFGVQLYFQYIWIPLAALASLRPEMWFISRTRKKLSRRVRWYQHQGAVAGTSSPEIASPATV